MLRLPIGSRRYGRTFALLLAAALLAVVAAQPAGATAGAQSWASRLAGPPNAIDGDGRLAVSPDGSRVFATGTVDDFSTGSKIQTVAYDTSDGTQLWLTHYNLAGGSDQAAGIAVAPDGSSVFVTGTSGNLGALDYITIAYDATTGARLWKRRFSSPLGISRDEAAAIGVSPDGSSVFVTGAADGGPAESDYLTVAYDAHTGQQRWTARHEGPYRESARTLAVSPDGSAVFVSGYTVLSGTGLDILTVAYAAGTGEQLWKKRYDGPKSRDDQANAMQVSPDGSVLYVTGFSEGTHAYVAHPDRDFITLAYRASNGAQRWARRYNGPNDSNDNAKAMVVSPDGSRVFVCGYRGGHQGRDFETIAYSSKGQQVWLRAYNGMADNDDEAVSIGVRPDGQQVFVTGMQHATPTSRDYATLAYRASSGAGVWGAVYDGSTYDYPAALGVSPDGSSVFVTGVSGLEFATVAYATT
jgi:putative pyrroloquinoline-quinone binding quinoprotein